MFILTTPHILISQTLLLGQELPHKEELTQEVLESCVKYVRLHVPDLPQGDANDRFANTDLAPGVVAIFWYPPSELYPSGTKHLAYVAEVQGDYFFIQQTNKVSGVYTEEWVHIKNPNLLGFYLP